jgi:hypothetical protein
MWMPEGEFAEFSSFCSRNTCRYMSIPLGRLG